MEKDSVNILSDDRFGSIVFDSFQSSANRQNSPLPRVFLVTLAKTGAVALFLSLRAVTTHKNVAHFCGTR